MPQKKQTKKIKIKVRDLTPSKDTKGGGQKHPHQRQHPHESGHDHRQH